MAWTPMGADPSTHHTLVEGIPQYMHAPVRQWFANEFMTLSNGSRVRWVSRMQRYDLAARGRIAWAETLASHGPEMIFDAIGDEDRLRFIDWLLYDNVESFATEVDNEKLESILVQGGSAWMVGSRDGVVGLERRVPEGVQVSAETAMALPGDAGRLLSEAWHSTFGVSPDFEKAYSKAVKAVEAAVIPVVSPNHTTATLGTVLGQMRSDNDWGLDMTKEHTTHTSAHVVLGMAQALWTGQADRHAGNTYTPSTQAEAEAAVFFAVPLVQWFSSGAVARR